MRRFCIWLYVLCFFTPLTRAADPFATPLTPTDSFDVGTLHIDKFGSGKQSLILIPGLACGPWVWSDTIQKFAPTYTIYALTLPGFDGRPVAQNEPSLFAAFTRDFWTFFEKQKIEKPIIIGHSIGGTLAIALAEDHPDRLSAIVALDGLPVFPMAANATPEQRQALAKQMAAMSLTMTPDAELAANKNYMSTIGTNKPDLVEPTAKLESKSDPKAVAAWMSEDLTTDLRPNLKNITIPLLEIMPYDPAENKSPFSYSQEQTLTFYKSLLAGAPHATVLPITPSRHFAMLDQPESFYKALTDFLSAAH